MHNRPRAFLLFVSIPFLGLCCVWLFGLGAKSAPLPMLTQNVTAAAQYTVLDASGAPLRGARIYPVRSSAEGAISGGGSRWVNPPLLADAAGQFRLTDATIERIIVLPAASDNDPTPAPFFAQVGKNAPFRIVRPASVSLRVRFVDGDNKPMTHKDVMVFPIDKPAVTKTTLGVSARGADERKATVFVVDASFPGVPSELAAALTSRTDTNGVALFPALPQDARVSLTIDAQPGKRRPLCLAGSILLHAGSAADTDPLTIVLPFDGEITGQVLQKSTNKPVAGVRVYLHEPGPSSGIRAPGPRADAQGRFRFTGLYPATYYLGFDDLDARGEAPRYLQTEPARVTLTAATATEENTTEKTTNNSMRATKNVLLARAGQVHVTVRDARGRPLFAQEVTLENARGGGGGCTNLNGKITLRDLPGPSKIVWTTGANLSAVRTLAEKPILLREGQTHTVTFGASPKRIGHGVPLRALAPDFVGHDRNGKPIHLSSFRGKTVVLDFVYLFDPPEPNSANLGALRIAEAAARAVGADDKRRVVFVAVCSGGGDASKTGWLLRALDKRKQAFPHVVFLQEAWDDPQHPARFPSATAAFHMDGWPQRFVIGPDGTLRNAYGASDYGGSGFNERSLSDAPRLLHDIHASAHDSHTGSEVTTGP